VFALVFVVRERGKKRKKNNSIGGGKAENTTDTNRKRSGVKPERF